MKHWEMLNVNYYKKTKTSKAKENYECNKIAFTRGNVMDTNALKSYIFKTLFLKRMSLAPLVRQPTDRWGLTSAA